VLSASSSSDLRNCEAGLRRYSNPPLPRKGTLLDCARDRPALRRPVADLRLSCTHYSMVMLNGVVTTIGAYRKVAMRFTAKSDIAVNSISAETGKPLHAQAA
jgi:hypothetical protein